VRTGLPCQLLIAAAGIDGEIPPETIRKRLLRLGARRLPALTSADLAAVRHVLDWHPSEASGLLAAAATGCRGRVEVRDAGDQVELTATTPELFAANAKTEKAHRRSTRPAHTPTTADLPAIDRRAHQARERGANYISTRRLAELLGANTLEAYTAFTQLLAYHRPSSYEPSLYRVE
jgi:hypothetical protein